MWLRVSPEKGEPKTLRLTSGTFVIGRDENAELVLDDEEVSRRHASLELRDDGRVLLRDLDSRNGTFVNGRKIQEPTLLEGNELLRIGNTSIRLSRTERDDRATVLAPRPGEAAPTRQPARPLAVPTAPTPAAPRSSQSRIERLMLQRTARRATVLAVIAIVVAALGITAGALVATGVIGGDDGLSVPEVIDTVEPSTVLIKATRGDEGGSGTGWVLDADKGLVVTNAHVVNGGTKFTIGVGAANEERRAELVGVAPCEDLAVLRVENRSRLRSIALGSQATLEQGNSVVAVGYPVNASLEDRLVATTGVVSQVRTAWRLPAPDIPRYPNLVQTTATINPGNSGGPLVDDDAQLVGVNSAFTIPGQGQNYAIGVDRVRTIVGTLRQGRSLAWTGMNLDFLDPQDPEGASRLRELSLPSIPGISVRSVVPGTSADFEGIGEFPVLIVRVNGRRVDGLQSYCAAVGDDSRNGDEATFTLAWLENGSLRAQEKEVSFE